MEEKTPKPRRRSRAKATIKEETASAPQPEKKDAGTSPQPEQNDAKTIKVEIQKYKSFVDALGDFKKVFRVILTIVLVGVLLFTGITAIVISVKRFYPYNDITTNALGATTLKNEDKEISYWLLNTAEPWANSGIKVKAGQTITVRSSGKKHTAMHHLYEDARKNEVTLREPWVGTKGFSTKEDQRKKRDAARAKYKIFPSENQDELLMQIVPDGNVLDLRPRFYDEANTCFKDSENRFLVIGDRQDNIYIDRDGVLYFGINDIILDDATIVEMMLNICKNDYNDRFESDAIKLLPDLCLWRTGHVSEYRDNPKALLENPVVYESFVRRFGKKTDEIKKVEITEDGEKKVTFGDFEFGTTINTEFIELYGYFMYEYQTPWYDDNLGSFLIVVESSSN